MTQVEYCTALYFFDCGAAGGINFWFYAVGHPLKFVPAYRRNCVARGSWIQT